MSTIASLSRTSSAAASASSADAVRHDDSRFGVKPFPPVTITVSGGTAATNAALGTHFRITTTGSFTLSNPTNLTDGQVLVWEIKCSSGGTITLGTLFHFGSDITGITAVASGKKDFLQGVYNSTDGVIHVIGYRKGF